MTRTNEMLEKLSKVNPVADEDRHPEPSSRQSQAPRRFRIAAGVALAGALAVVILVVVALNPSDDSDGVVAAAAATAAEQPFIAIADDEYAFRTEMWFQAAIPGDVVKATPSKLEISGADADPPARAGEREVWFSPRDRGKVEGDDGTSWPRCSAADWVLALATDDFCWTDIGGPQGMNYLFEAPPGIRQMFEARGNVDAPAYWEFSPDIADLGSDPQKINSAVDDLGRELQDRQGSFTQLGNYRDAILWDPAEPDDSAYKLRAAADLLANPLAPPEVRAALFEYAGSIDGVETSDKAVDPTGREGSSISVTSTPADVSPTIASDLPSGLEDPISQYATDGYTLDLSGLTLRTEVIFDPDSSELLAEQTEMVSADDPLFGPWLDREGAPQVIYSRTFDPITVVASTGSDSRGGD